MNFSAVLKKMFAYVSELRLPYYPEKLNNFTLSSSSDSSAQVYKASWQLAELLWWKMLKDNSQGKFLILHFLCFCTLQNVCLGLTILAN